MKNNSIKKYMPLLIVFLIFNVSAARATSIASLSIGGSGNFYHKFLLLLLGSIAIALLLVGAFLIYRSFSMISKMQLLDLYKAKGLPIPEHLLPKRRNIYTPGESSWWERQVERWNGGVPVEREQDILMHHDYDGIKELDNSLPPWWVAMFYMTIGFSLIYMVYYHWGGSGPSMLQEYKADMAVAEKAAIAFQNQQADKINESSVTALTDEAALSGGKTIFIASCAACHGANGEGGVGPNLTDEYWLHGGGVKNIFKVIKHGVPEKGMIAWKDQLRASDIQRISSYILTLQGTKPANGKAPQGDIWKEEAKK